MSIAFSILSVGEEHNNELFNLLSTLGNKDVYIYTDVKNGFGLKHQIIFDDGGEFNFNKKVYALESALEYNDTIICLDTDISIRNELSFEKLEELDTGLYVSWMGKSQTHKGKKTSIYQIFQGNADKELVDYVNSLIPYGANVDNLYFFDEFVFIVVIKDKNLKTKFIDTWKKIYLETETFQPLDRHKNELRGACESIIISLVCDVCGIKLIDDNPIVKLQLTHILHNATVTEKRNIL